VHQKNPEALLLTLWVFGTLAFATWFNWSITARTLLPMVPAVAILTVAQFKHVQKRGWLKYLPLFGAAILSMLIAAADYRQANCARAAARVYQRRFGADANNVRSSGIGVFSITWSSGARSLSTVTIRSLFAETFSLVRSAIQI
jgi:hypothetical protein